MTYIKIDIRFILFIILVMIGYLSASYFTDSLDTSIGEDIIDTEATYTIKGYNITLKEDIGSVNTLGKSYYEGKSHHIVIQTGRSKKEIEQTCNHEVLHTLFPMYRHTRPRHADSIYYLEDKVELPTCNKLMEKLEHK